MNPEIEMIQGKARAEAWNRSVPAGTPCLFVTDLGEIIETVTRSEAWCLGHGAPVVSVKGRSGGIALERVFPCDNAESLGDMLERAARDLPAGAVLTIEVERGCGSVALLYATGESEIDAWDRDTFSERVAAAIEGATQPYRQEG